MKKKVFLIPIILLLIVPLMLTSCKKTEKSITENSISMSVAGASDLNELDLINSTVSISGKLIPENVGTSISIKITSGKDSEGITISSNLTDFEEKDGKILYQSKKFSESIKIAAESDASNNTIAVNEGSDEIKINIENGLYEGTFPVNSGKILEFDFGSYPSIKIYGYSYEGNEREAIQISTDRVPNPRLMKLDYTETEGFNYYYKSFHFHDQDYSQYDGNYWIGIDTDDSGVYSGNVYFKYYEQEFSSSFGETGTHFLESTTTK